MALTIKMLEKIMMEGRNTKIQNYRQKINNPQAEKDLEEMLLATQTVLQRMSHDAWIKKLGVTKKFFITGGEPLTDEEQEDYQSLYYLHCAEYQKFIFPGRADKKSDLIESFNHANSANITLSDVQDVSTR